MAARWSCLSLAAIRRQEAGIRADDTDDRQVHRTDFSVTLENRSVKLGMEGLVVKRRIIPVILIMTGMLAVAGARAMSAQDKYALKVPGGLAFSEFRGYEGWQVVSISQDGKLIAVTLANPVAIEAYLAGIPGNGKPFPDGAKLAKIHWNPTKMTTFPAATVPGTQHDVDFMVKDSKRFPQSGGWGWAVFDYDSVSDTFKPGTLADHPPQGNNAECGLACHTIVKSSDYVFTNYAHK
jgi:hypothetical protein